MSKCNKSSQSCENLTNTDHGCPMSRIDGQSDSLCRCCEVCKNGCRANRDQILNKGRHNEETCT